MFEGLSISGEKNPVDILNSLMDPENIALKSQFNIEQIKVLVVLKWYKELALPENKDKDPRLILDVVIQYYMILMCSLNRQSRTEVIRGLSELKQELFEIQAMNQNKGK